MSKTIDMVLTEVRESAPLTAAQVAANLGISERAARRALDWLESNDLIESENYQRRARVFLPVEAKS